MAALQPKSEKITEPELRHGLTGNLCRCTGYSTVVTAVEKCMDDTADDD